MTQLLARFTVTVFVRLMGLMILLRVQPYDDHGLRELLLPENCSAPCFMGIRLGVTTVEEAIRILEQHQWVDKVDIDETGISWTWSKQQPAIIDSFYNGILGTDQQQSVQVADSILIRIRARLGDLQAVFGYSRRYYNHKSIRAGVTWLDSVAMVFDANWFMAVATTHRPQYRSDFWYTRPLLMLDTHLSESLAQ